MVAFSGATLDSRLVKPGMLFVAIKGEHVDGHDFIDSAKAKGAVGILDGEEALVQAAKEYRKTLKAKVIGITGSAGKTTTKELVAAFLRAGGYKVHATAGNFNNQLGLPLTILNAPPTCDFLVLEMGTNHPGEIAHLVDIAKPDIGIISSIGTAHLEFFTTQDGIADEKGTLLRRVTDFAVLARENERYERLQSMCDGVRLITVSQKERVAERLRQALQVRLPGTHNVANALLALACAQALGVSEADALKALETFSLPGGRWRVVECKGVTYIDDTYNANPTAMKAALQTFADLPIGEGGRKVAVLGDMFELGEQSVTFHQQVAEFANSLPLDEVILVGNNFGGITCVEAKNYLAKNVKAGDYVLLKASHSMQLDVLVPKE